LTWLLNAIEKDKGDTNMMSTFDIMTLKSENEQIRVKEEKEHRKIRKRIIARIKRSQYSQVLIRIMKYVLRKI
jgi:exosome complex RNA-binding protein Csl4